MKFCSKCKLEKDESDFWIRNNRKSGVNSECKECAKIRRTQAYRERNAEMREKRRIYYQKNRQKLCKSQVDSQKGNRRYRKYQNQYSIKKVKSGDKKYVARRILNMAVRCGMVQRPDSCEKCFARIKVEGHHEDYNKPLDVVWVCKKCHLEIHRSLDKGK